MIEIPRYLWKPILHGLVLTLRPKKLAPRYAGIWLQDGSPLMVYSRRQAEGVAAALREAGVDATVELGMRYGNPSIPDAIGRLRAQGCERILTVPLYPQYAASTTATVVDAVTRHAGRLRDQPELRFIKRFHEDAFYLDALAGRIESYWREHGRPQKLVMSFHGLPRYSIELGDPYYRDCMETARLLSQRLSLPREQIEVTFQSRFGAARWLEPYTEPTLKMLAAAGVTDVDVVCPVLWQTVWKPWRKSARNAAMPSSRPAAGSSATFRPERRSGLDRRPGRLDGQASARWGAHSPT